MVRNRVRAFVAAAVLSTATGLAAQEVDVAWIGALPGLTAQTSRATADGVKAVYTLTGDAREAMARVRQGLDERGWTIEKSTEVPAGEVSLSTLAASKGGARVKITVANAMGMRTLTVSLSGAAGGAAPAAASTERAAEAPTTSGGAAVTTAGGLVVAGNAVTETHDCADGDVSVTASRSGITLRGTCRTVKVAGNSNTVTIEGSVQAIHAVGRANTVTWSAGKNPRPPEVKHVGSQNRVRSDAER